MGGQAFELLGLVALTGVAGGFAVVLAWAGVEASEDSPLVGVLFMGFALVLLLTAFSVGAWGTVEWCRADGTRAIAAAQPSRDSEGRIRTLRAALMQTAFIELACKVAFFCCTINVAVEMFLLRRCKRIFLIVTPPNHHYCDNLSYRPGGMSAYSPQSHTFLTELPATVRLLPCARAACVLAQCSFFPLTLEWIARRGLSGSSVRYFHTLRLGGRFWAIGGHIRALEVCSATRETAARAAATAAVAAAASCLDMLAICATQARSRSPACSIFGLQLQHAVFRGWTRWTVSSSARGS